MFHFCTGTLWASFNSMWSLKAFHFQDGFLVGFSFYRVILSIAYNSSIKEMHVKMPPSAQRKYRVKGL